MTGASERVRFIEWDTDLDAASMPEDARGFLRLLGAPVLILQAGRDPSRTRIVSTLLHANEPSGLIAVQRWLRSGSRPATTSRRAHRPLPRLHPG